MDSFKSLTEEILNMFPLLRLVLQRGLLLFFFLVGGGLIVLDSLNLSKISSLRAFFLETNLCLEKISCWPMVFYSSSLEQVEGFWRAREQLKQLEKKMSLQEDWEIKARLLQRENNRLKGLLNLIPSGEKAYAVAEIYARSKGLAEDSFLLTISGGQRVSGEESSPGLSLQRPSLQGPPLPSPSLSVLSPVVMGKNLVGYVKECGVSSALVCPVTSVQSRVPVISEKSGLKAIVAGENQGFLKLLHVENSDDFEEGELLFSTSEGSLYPDHYVVGRIAFDANKKLLVLPIVSISSLSHVFVLPPVARR